ncbi:lysophospholipid acyltransferase family protein [Candidatus Binatia bacterium]|jgi:KDO2-lipid IV(A) lauroyltransferase|nr:lysophospholipid acyltransferase family protein [Candidatus Binatia bacterium]
MAPSSDTVLDHERLTEAAPDGLADALAQGRFRHDGLFWRRLAYRGSAEGPEWWKRTSPAAIATVLFAAIPTNRRGVIANLRRIEGSRGPVADRWSALRTFVQFAYCLTETLEHASPYARPLTVDEPPEISAFEALPRDQGVVVLTSHFGSWEIAASLMQRLGRRVNVVMAREANPSVEAFQSSLRERCGLRVLHSDSSPFASLNMLQALRRGEIVAIQIDRSAPGHVTRPIEFFGAPAPFQYGPFALARLAGVPLWPVFAVRLGTRRYRILPEPLRTIPRDASEQDVLAVMRDVACSFERHVRAYPNQWFQFAPFWDQRAGR